MSIGRGVAAAQFEHFAVGGGERGLEWADLLAAVTFLVCELRGEFADDAAVVGAIEVFGAGSSWWGRVAQAFDACAQRGGAVEEVG
jgi:hypothetical protein